MRVISSCLATLLTLGLAAAPANAAVAAPIPTSRLVVGTTPGADIAAVVAGLGDLRYTSEPTYRPVPGLDAFILEVSLGDRAAVFATLAGNPAVRYAEVDGLIRADAVADPFEQANRLTGSYNQITGAWTWGTGSPAVTVAVVDSGVSVTEDLGSDRLAPGYDFVDGDTDPVDDDNHGTLVAHTIAAQHANQAGGLGVCGQCRIMPVRVLQHRTDGAAGGLSSDVAAGIVWAAERDAQIINLSLSTSVRSRVLEDAVAAATGQGALIVASAGDDDSVKPLYPAAIEPVLAVGSAQIDGVPYPGANRNSATSEWVDIAAYRFYAALNAKSVRQNLSGSSASAALVSGAAALGLATKPGATAADLRTALLASGVRSSWMQSFDAPALDAAGALTELGAADDKPPSITVNFANLEHLRGGRLRPVLAVTDDHAVRRYEVEAAGTVVRRDHGWDPMPGITVPAGWNGPFTFTVRAWDYAGNLAERSRTVVVDSTAPAGTITAPAEGAPVPDGPVDVVYTASAAENLTVSANDVVLASADGLRWTGKVAPDANGLIRVVAQDRAGNRTELVRKVVVDSTEPSGVIQSPANGKHLRGTTVDVLFTQQTTEKLRSVTANGVAMKQVGSTLSWQARVVPSTGGWIEIAATDLAGNVFRASNWVVLDNAGPTATTMSPASKAKVRKTFTATLSGVTDASGIAATELRANGRLIGRNASSFKVATGSFSGNVDLVWKLTDKLGNTRTYTRVVVADNKAPTVSITKAPKHKAKVKGTVKVYVKAADASGIARVELIVNGKVVARDAKSGYVLSVNTAKQKKTMKVQVRAYDKLGNVTFTSARTWYRK